MRKSLLIIASLFSLSAFCETTFSFDWSKLATVGSNKQTTVQEPLILSDGNLISVTTATAPNDFKFGGESIDLKDEGSTIGSNLILMNLSSDGKLNWSFNSVLGGVNFSSGAIAEMPGQDLAMTAFTVRFNKAGDTASDVVKFLDAKGNSFSVPMECPQDYNPYTGVIMLFKPSTGEIVSLKKISSSYSTKVENKYCAQPLFITGVAATENGFYITGYAYTETVFPGEAKFVPSKIPADWNGTGTVGNGFTAMFSPEGICTKIAETAETEDAREGNYLIRTLDNQIVVVGMSNSALLYFNYDSELNLIKSGKFLFSDASNGGHNVLLKKLDITPSSAFVSGHLAGGFEGTDIKTTGTSNEQFGFVLKINRNSATISGGGVEDAKISGYYGAYENENDGNLYAIGYNMNQKAAFVQPYTSTWEKKERINLFTTIGTPAIWSTAFDSKSNALYVPGRSNNKVVLGETVIAEGMTAFSGFLAKYNATDFKLSAVDETIADTMTASLSVRGGSESIIVTATEATTINIYNISGSLVRSVKVPAGESVIGIAAGFYIAGGHKVIVR